MFEIEGTFANAFGAVDDKSQQLQSFLRQFSEQREQNDKSFSIMPSRDENAPEREQHSDKNLVILELGIGSRNTLIKQPLMQLTAQLPNARYITLNLERELYIPNEIADKSIGLAGDIGETLRELKGGI